MKAATVALLLLMACVPALAQSQIVHLQQGDTLEADCPVPLEVTVNGSYVKAVCPVGSTPTDTPTATPTATASPTPTVTASPMPPTGAEPNINAPYCTDIGLTHDPHAWHPHWNAEAGCFWDEFHGDDPNSPDIVSIFGEKAYPIFSHVHASSPAEHIVKHLGDIVIAVGPNDPRRIPCGNADDGAYSNDADQFQNKSVNDCVRAFRIVLHADDAADGFLFTVHSYSAEYQVCTQESNYQDCGIMRVKGHMFFDTFRTPFYTSRDLRPGCTVVNPGDCEFNFGYPLPYEADQPISNFTGEPYVQVQHNSNDTNLDTLLTGYQLYRSQLVSWSMNEIGPCNDQEFPDGICGNNYLRFAFKTWDAGVIPNESDLNHSANICFGEPNCWYDASIRGVFETQAWIPQSWDSLDGKSDNHLTKVIWVDRFQKPQDDQSACTSEKLGDTPTGDCFKMEFENYPLSAGAASNKINGSESLRLNRVWYIKEYNQCQPDFDCKVRRVLP